MINIIDIIRQHSINNQDKLALAWVSDTGKIKETLTYQQIINKIDQISAYLSEKGKLCQGDIVALLFPPGLDFILTFLACLQLGLIPVPLKIPAREKRLTTILPILYDCKPKFIISPNIIAATKNFPFAWLAYQSSYHTTSFTKPKKLDEIAFLQYTSGATGDPKGVMVTHRNLIHNFNLMHKYFKVKTKEVMVSWLPHYHDMGLIGAYLGTLYLGHSGYFMAPSSFMLNPNAFLQLISDVQATTIQCPNAAYDWMIEQCDKRDINLSALRNILNGAEPIQISTLEKFYETFKTAGLRKESIKAAYGLAEATLFVTQTNTPHWISHHRHVSCGISSEIDIRIVDPNSYEECAPGIEGEIWLNSESNALGYYNKPKLTQEIFHAKILGHDGLYLRTGDLGYILDNQLYITGRLKDIIIINGANIYPQDIEFSVEKFPGILPHRSVAFSWHHGTETKVVVLAEVNKNKIPNINKLIKFILKNHSIPLFDLVLCPQGSLVKTTSGKVKRQASKQLYKENNIPILKQMEKTWGITEFIINTYQNCPTETFYELGIDSLTMANLVFEVEKYLPTKIKKEFSIPQLYQMQIGEFIHIVNKKNTSERQTALTSWHTRINQIANDRLNQIKQDAILTLSVASNLQPYCAKSKIKNILLTGSTGFIGAYLLLNLLKKTHYHLHLIVRGENTHDIHQRVINNLKKYKLLEEADKYHLKDRITLYCGDLSKNMLGVTPTQWNTLSEIIDSIYHNGAITNYVASYEDLKSANVDGTNSIISLALTQRVKYIHYMSTTFIFGWASSKYVEEDGNNSTFEHVDFGYSQSKWVAEQLIWQAQKLGVPIQIYRPSWVTASDKGQYTEDDIITRAMTYMINHHVVLNISNQVSMMPVNKVAADVISLSLLNQPKKIAYHLTTEYVNMPMIAKYVTAKYGYQFSYLSLEKFNQHLQKFSKPKDLIYPLVPFFNMHYRKIARTSNKIYTRKNYLNSLAEIDNSPKEYSYQEATDFIIKYLQHKQLIPTISELHMESILKSHKMKERRTPAYLYLKMITFIKKMIYVLRLKQNN